jgi:outer membrane protein X
MRTTILALLLLCVLGTKAQTFQAFKVGLVSGYAIPSSGSGSKASGLLALEPQYALNDNFSLGLRLEAAYMIRVADNGANGTDAGSNTNLKLNASYMVTGDYYFSTNTFRPFIGTGIGLYTVHSVAVVADGSLSPDISETKFGAFPRVGFEAGRFRVAVEYNLVAKTTLNDLAGSSAGSVNNNYLGIKIGTVFGGGRKKN